LNGFTLSDGLERGLFYTFVAQQGNGGEIVGSRERQDNGILDTIVYAGYILI
jgi:hypothetical protein